MLTVNQQPNINGAVSYPDKSLTHRALILSSIAQGVSTITNASLCQDCMSTIGCLRQLGADIVITNDTVTVTPISNLPNKRVTLQCNNSGTTARLLAGLCVGLNIEADLVGDSSLCNRPMDRVIIPLRLMGGNIVHKPNCLFSINKRQQLHGISYTMPISSAQVKSAILIASLFCQGSTTVTECQYTRNHTELMLDSMGCDIMTNDKSITISPSRLHSIDIDIPNDFSSAMYAIVAQLISGQGQLVLPNVGINDTRCSALYCLLQCGASVDITNTRHVCGEKVADIIVSKSIIDKITMNTQQCAIAIDDLIAMAIVAVTNNGGVFYSVSELAHKESNRIQGIVQLVESLGGSCVVSDDNIIIYSSSDYDSRHVVIDTHNDHRIAMSAIVAGTVANGCTIDNYNCIDVSCNTFFELLGIQYSRYALIGGSQCSNSISPVIHATFARQCRHNVSYDIISDSYLTDSQLLDIISCYNGCNITMPYKERVARLLASDMYSVNTVKDNKGYSTDGYGLVNSLAISGIDTQGNILIIGAGGASRAIIEQLAQGGNIHIVNRTKARCNELIEQYSLLPMDSSCCYDLVISCVPPCQYELDIISSLDIVPRVVMTLSYKGNQPLQQYCLDNDIGYYQGLDMLWLQASKSYSIWSGVSSQELYDIVIRNRSQYENISD